VFNEPQPRHHSNPSRQSETSPTAPLLEKIFDAIANSENGLTCKEVVDVLGRGDVDWVRTSIKKLTRAGRIHDTGERRLSTRAATTHRGNRSRVYRVGKEAAVSPAVVNGGLIYFIELVNMGYIKIGYTTNMKSRMKDLRIGSPFEHRIIGTIPGTEVEENAIQERFSYLHVRGEWFLSSAELRAAIEVYLKLVA
jgi:hypothetical protein